MGKFPTDSAGWQTEHIEGDVAHDAVDEGAPVKIGGYAHTNTPGSVANGDRVQFWSTPFGAQIISPGNGTSATDGFSNSMMQLLDFGGTSRPLGIYNFLYNGGTWDRVRNNETISILTSAARTTTQTSSDQTAWNLRGILVFLNVTSAGTGSITLEIQGKDPVSLTYYPILTGAAVTTNGLNVYRVHPELTAVANQVAKDIIPRNYRIVVTHNNANSITYSVGISVCI